PRHFSQTSRILLLSRHSLRPQLPYLSQPALYRQQPLINYQINRLLSAETTSRFRDQVFLTAKWLAIVWAFIFAGSLAVTAVLIELQERKNPTPAEWRFWTRQALRDAREEANAVKEQDKVAIDWAAAGGHFRNCLKRLEDADVDGNGLFPVGGTEDGLGAEEILIPGVGKAGFDITRKSYEWRTCYFEVLMGCGLAAEHLDGMMVDLTRKFVFPRSMVVGPSNPDPRPVPSFMGHGIAPLEENCEPAYPAPETYYMRILTGKGFTTKQKLQAAEAYANWLDYKGLPASAEEMYRWAIDISKAAMPVPAGVVLDETTNVLKEDAGKEATPNLLRATTALAIHHARTGNVSAALPMLLSILRARRDAPVSPTPYSSRFDSDADTKSRTDIGQGIAFVRNVFRSAQFADPPASGDEPLTRPSPRPICEESEIMLYIGEIIFANDDNDQRKSEGLGWTRQAVRIAEMSLEDPEMQLAEKRKCRECLLAGVQNLETMLRQLSVRQKTTAAREGGRSG
ncbi:hypothetical protein BDY17DRAFT_239255, partial [Neohortaea acidophila]